jgi:hypothetical protein
MSPAPEEQVEEPKVEGLRNIKAMDPNFSEAVSKTWRRILLQNPECLDQTRYERRFPSSQSRNARSVPKDVNKFLSEKE